MWRVEMTDRAWQDLREAYRWVAAKAPRDVAAWHSELVRAISSLAWFQERCPLAPESFVAEIEIRHLIHQSHRILFRIDPPRVIVIHVRHGARAAMTREELGDAEL